MRFNIKKLHGADITGIDENELIKYFEKRGATNLTGDVCKGDILWFARDEFEGSYRRPKFAGTFLYRVKVIKDSYGSKTGQHTFTVELMKSGTSKNGSGETFRINGRNLYKHFCMVENADRPDREEKLADKHERGQAARKISEQHRKFKELKWLYGSDIDESDVWMHEL